MRIDEPKPTIGDFMELDHSLGSVFLDVIAPVFMAEIALFAFVHLIILQGRSGVLRWKIFRNPHGLLGPVESEPGDDPYDIGMNDKDIL